MMKLYQKAMLDAGWLAVRDLSGKVNHWQDPNHVWHVWDDWEVEAHFNAGDCGNVPKPKPASHKELT